MRHGGLILVGTLLLIPSFADAQVGSASQVCADGRVASEATEGRCCWPNQTWNGTAGRCEGAPACPPGLAAAGDDCVGTVQQAQVPPVPVQQVPPPPQTQYYQQPVPLYAQPIVVPPRRQRQMDDGLLITGIVLLGSGYVAGLLTTVLDGTTAENCALRGSSTTRFSCGGEAWGAIPVVGTIIGTALPASRVTFDTLAASIPAATAQVVGAILTVIGAVGSEAPAASSDGAPEGGSEEGAGEATDGGEEDEAPPGVEARVTVVPSAPGADVFGLSVTGQF